RRPLGIAIVGGLIVSQALTLFTTPVVYLYLDRLRLRISAWRRAHKPPQWAQRHLYFVVELQVRFTPERETSRTPQSSFAFLASFAVNCVFSGLQPDDRLQTAGWTFSCGG